MFYNYNITINNVEMLCDVQPDNKNRSNVLRIFCEPEFEVERNMKVIYNNVLYKIIENYNWIDYIELYIKRID